MDSKKEVIEKLAGDTRENAVVPGGFAVPDTDYQSLIDCMPGNVYWFDTNCRSMGGNRNVVQMLGLETAEQLRGLSFDDLKELGGWTQKAADSFKQDTLDVLKTKKPKFNIEEPPIPDASGRAICFLTSRAPIFNKSGGVVGVIGVSIDITDLKETESALVESKDKTEKAIKFKSDFIANMSHDLRTPLSSIIGLSDLLLTDGSQESSTLFLSQINQSAKELLTISNEVLEIVSAGIRSSSDHLKVFSVEKLLDRLSNALAPVSTQKGIDLCFEIDKSVPATVCSSYINIHRVLLNLIGNSLKFTRVGSVTCRVTRPDSDQSELSFVVTDTGIGIDEDKIDAIFEPFKRLTTSTSDSIPGSGLGLYMVKTMIAEVGGSVSLTSRKGEGSQATVMLPFFKAGVQDRAIYSDAVVNMRPIPAMQPLDKDAAKRVVSRLSTVANAPVGLIKKDRSIATVLVVEDNLPAQLIARNQLESLGCTVSVVGTSAEAIEDAGNTCYDLIFMDLGLPDADGVQTTRQIRSDADSASRYSSILALTAHASKQEREACMRAGVSVVLHKPLTSQKIKQIMGTFLMVDAF